MPDMEFNKRLREERLRQGWSLEEVEEETKIRKYYLEALENGNFRVLPPPVYASGFVKRYAILLGLDEKEMVAEFRALAYGEEEEPAVVEEEPAEVVSREREPRKPLPIKHIKNIAAGIVFLIIALWLGSYLVSYIANWSKNHTTPPDQTGAQQKQALPQNQTNSQTPPQQSTTPEQTTPPPASTNQSGVTVDLEATARCWVSITVDGKNTFTGTLIAGDKKSFNGKKNVVLNAGNSGGLKITVNGQLQPALGATGEHKIKEYKAGQ